MQNIIVDINNKIAQENCFDSCLFNASDVRNAVSRLKPHKRDACNELSSDHIINACDELFVHIAWLFNAIIVHGTLPDSFLLSTIVPIPKGRNANVSDSSNFRGIALSSMYGKLIDNIILQRFSDRLQTSELQFGFKAKSSTNLCTFVLKETLSYYAGNQSFVFCTFLDATKAFDRVIKATVKCLGYLLIEACLLISLECC